MLEQGITNWFNRTAWPRLFPLPPGYQTAGPSLDELRPLFQRTQIGWGAVGMLAYIPICAVIWYAMHALTEWRASGFEPTAFHFYDRDGKNMLLPAGFLSIIPAYGFYQWLVRLSVGREQYQLFERYQQLSMNYDMRRASKWGLAVVLPLIGLGTLALVNYRSAIYADRMICESWMGFKRTARLHSDISEIVSAKRVRGLNGKTIAKQVFEVRYSDGAVWKSERQFAKIEEIELAIFFIFLQSGKPIHEIPILE